MSSTNLMMVSSTPNEFQGIKVWAQRMKGCSQEQRKEEQAQACVFVLSYQDIWRFPKFKFKFCSFFATASMQQLFALQHHPNSSVHEVLECLFFKKDMKFWWSSRSAINHALTRLSSSFLPHPHGYLPPLSLGSCTNIDCVSSDTSALCSLSFCDYHQRVFISSCSYCPKDYPYNWYEWRWRGEGERMRGVAKVISRATRLLWIFIFINACNI